MTQPPNLPPQQPSPILNYAQSSKGLREIAQRQKIILLCILVELIAAGCQFLAPVPIRPLFAILGLGVNIVASVFVFMLAIKIYGTGLGITLGILTLIPCLGLLILLIVNGKATALLRAGGLKVGLLGATVPEHFNE